MHAEKIRRGDCIVWLALAFALFGRSHVALFLFAAYRIHCLFAIILQSPVSICCDRELKKNAGFGESSSQREKLK